MLPSPKSRVSDQSMMHRPLARLLVGLGTLGVLFYSALKAMTNVFDESQQVKLALLEQRFVQQVQRLHGLWYKNGRPAHLTLQLNSDDEALSWVAMNKAGWPISVANSKLTLRTEMDCDSLWSGLVDNQLAQQSGYEKLEVATQVEFTICQFWRVTNEERQLLFRYNSNDGKSSSSNLKE